MASFYKSGFPQIPFVGREEEREFLSARLDEVMAGNGCSIFIRGSPGIGKTRLALTALEEVEREGSLVLHGKARWRETPYVYEPFVEALRELRRRRKPFTSKELNELIEPHQQGLTTRLDLLTSMPFLKRFSSFSLACPITNRCISSLMAPTGWMKTRWNFLVISPTKSPIFPLH